MCEEVVVVFGCVVVVLVVCGRGDGEGDSRDERWWVGEGFVSLEGGEWGD